MGQASGAITAGFDWFTRHWIHLAMAGGIMFGGYFIVRKFDTIFPLAQGWWDRRRASSKAGPILIGQVAKILIGIRGIQVYLFPLINDLFPEGSTTDNQIEQMTKWIDNIVNKVAGAIGLGMLPAQIASLVRDNPISGMLK